MTVALPVLSAWGHETCVLPTAVLSTHTGGFGTPEIVHFDGELKKIWRHWQQNGITFDAILTGYLGSVAAVDAAADIVDRLLAPGGICLVDPAMADHGRMYSGLNEAYAQAVGALCRRADIILPNITEAAILTGTPWQKDWDGETIRQMLSKLQHPCVILTGGKPSEREMENYLWKQRRLYSFRHPCVPGSFSGTGDLFAACFTGALLHGLDIGKALEIAGELTEKCAQNTANHPAHWYGIRFETILPDICGVSKENT